MDNLKFVDNFLPLNVGKLYNGKPQVQYLPEIVLASRVSIGMLSAESFCERAISADNIVMTDGNTLPSDKELDRLVALRVNSDFVEWIRSRYGGLSEEQFCVSEIPLSEHKEEI